MAKRKESNETLNLILNILWIITFGWGTALFYLIAGLILCITVIGYPIGIQLVKMAVVMLFPFGKHVESRFEQYPILNIVWAILFGWETAIMLVFGGLLLCITVIGIPFGLQLFKIAKISLFPVGAIVR